MIQIKNIVKKYLSGENEVTALKDVSINFRNSEFVSILGPSGCGKTTMLNILGGLDKYTSGDIIINGVSTKDYKDKDWDAYRNHYIGFVFQSYNLISHLSILENVELALSIAGLNKKEKKKRALKALKEVGLQDQVKKRPNQLSGGQMQRVAIARAIVNEPKIILADEPTGALDSETSIQVMDILKRISDKYLIVMVTHNEDLANQYSTRIIRILDGKLIGDTSPYNPTQEEINADKITYDKKDTKEKERNKRKKIKTAMSYGTAFNLSLKNLWHKKGKTIIESLAGSIGIIGIALVLAVSSGFSNYINTMQSNALGNYPITVSAITVDMNKFKSFERTQENNGDVNDDVLVPYNPMKQLIQYGHYNNFTSDFVAHVEEFERKDKESNNPQLNLVEYNYYTPVKMITNSNGIYKYLNRNNSTSIMDGSTSSSLYPMLNNLDYVMNQYDLIYGSLPKVSEDGYSKEMLLVVGSGNKVSLSTLTNIGILTTTDADGNYANINFEDICNQEYKLILNDDYYIPDSNEFDSITSFQKLDTTDQTVLSTAFENASITLKISGVLRLKENATAEVLSTGLAYMPSLEEFYANNCVNSLIARKQLANKSSYTFYDNYVLSVAELSVIPKEGFANVEEINTFLKQQYGYELSKDEAFEIGLQQIGISSVPVSIRFYPKNFDAKDSVLSMIEEYNSKQTENSLKIVYSDTTEFLTSTLGQMIDIISYVLIAFASISLVVSSIMIGIITYSSVVERTKEIGVLRSIGARKKDISRIFNSETVLVGLFAGLLGVLISWILTFPISAIIKAIAGGVITISMAILEPLDAIVLVIISTLLTTIAGTVPARIASKKDPVKCLRSE
ncbi:MAG: ATP-binding cassette domain-containing protein [Christensenellales bacterium]